MLETRLRCSGSQEAQHHLRYILDRNIKDRRSSTCDDVMTNCHQVFIGVTWSLQLDLKAQGSKLDRGSRPNTRTKTGQVGKDRCDEFINLISLSIDQVVRHNLDGKGRINTKTV